MPRIDIDALEDEWEDDGGPRSRRSRRLSPAARSRIEQLDVARVVGVDRGRITIDVAGRTTEATLAGTMRGTKAVVGDLVRVRDEAGVGPPRIVEVLERTTALTRTADDEVAEERIVVANADQVVVVLAADYLEMGTRFLDRVLVAASVGGLEALACVNRRDLLPDEGPIEEVAARYERIGVPVRATCALTGDGVEELEELLVGRWSAFAGHSGVGKSSLFNRIVPGAAQQVAALGPRGGRHTTVAAWALRAEHLDAWLVDTPGVRSFGLGTLGPDELAGHFPELAGLACQIPGCTHRVEPGCRLPEADIHPERLASFLRLRASLAGGTTASGGPDAGTDRGAPGTAGDPAPPHQPGDGRGPGAVDA